MMNFYTVRKNTYYLDRSGYDAFQPVSMTQGKKPTASPGREAAW